MNPLIPSRSGRRPHGSDAKPWARQFGVDWPLFLSQLHLFIIVCVLLQKFAYKPIVDVLEERRQRIAEGLANAEKIKQRTRGSRERKQGEILPRPTPRRSG